MKKETNDTIKQTHVSKRSMKKVAKSKAENTKSDIIAPRQNRIGKTSIDKDLQVAIEYIQGQTVTELAEKYNMSRDRVLKIIKSPLMRVAMDDRARALSQVVRRVFSKHDRDFERMADLYFDRALDEEVVKRTNLGQLFGVLDVVSRRFEGIQRAELENRRMQLEILRLKMENKAIKSQVIEVESEEEHQDNSIIGGFMAHLRAQATPNLDKHIDSKRPLVQNGELIEDEGKPKSR